MSPKLASEASMLERELMDLASKEKAQYKRQTMVQTARLLRDLLNEDEDEPYTGPTDDL